MPASKFKIERICKECGKPFLAKTVFSDYCSKHCSDVAYRKRKKEEKEEERRQEKAAQIPEDRPYISIAEAVTLFGISKHTIYRLIRNGKLPALNLGERLTRISRDHIESMFKVVESTEAKQIEKQENKTYSFAPEDCYTVTQITEKYNIDPSTVYKNIRSIGIPTCQKGNFVYVPKSEIDQLYGSK